MQLQGITPREIWRNSTADVAGPLRERYSRVQALDNQAGDQDPRDGFVSVQRQDGLFQAILGSNNDGLEYTARVVNGDKVLRGESGSVSNDGTQVLASHYESAGQLAGYCGPGYFQDITTDTEAKTFFVRKDGQNSFSLESPTMKQWSTQGMKGFSNVSVLAEFPSEGAQAEEYFYGHNFDLSWNP